MSCSYYVIILFIHFLLFSWFKYFALNEANAHQRLLHFTRINNTLHCSALLSSSAQQYNPSSELLPSSSLLGMTPSPSSSHRHAKHFTPFILSAIPFELANCRDRLFVESEVWALCRGDYSESLLVISSREYNLLCAMWLLHDRVVCCTALNSHLHYNITLHRWLEVVSVWVWVIWFALW